MTHVSRRSFLKASALGAAAAAVALPASPLLVARAQTAGRIGRVYTLDKGAVRLHTYIAPDGSASVTSHIVETPNSLVVIDTQFLQTFAAEVKALADSVGKPIDRVILSHAHPDHFLGANQFADAPLVTTATIAAELDAYIAADSVQGAAALVGEAEVPPEVRPAEGSLELGDTVIDGVTFNVEQVSNAEATETLVIRIPEVGAVVLQDLLFSDNHFFPGVDRANWIAELENLRGNLEGFDTLLPGHGLPTTPGALDDAIAYLTFANETVANAATAQDIIDALQAEYPTYDGTLILSFWNQFFQPS
ncbi:MAG: MBL fold metallo-hydrolase [bacterium]|nr:MBL fold metallo-hydrolase [bacterium]